MLEITAESSCYNYWSCVFVAVIGFLGMHSLDGETGNFSVNFTAVRIQLHLSAVSPGEPEPALNRLKD